MAKADGTGLASREGRRRLQLSQGPSAKCCTFLAVEERKNLCRCSCCAKVQFQLPTRDGALLLDTSSFSSIIFTHSLTNTQKDLVEGQSWLRHILKSSLSSESLQRDQDTGSAF